MPLLECVNCSQRAESEALDVTCGRCGSAMILVGRELKSLKRDEFEELPLGVWRYRAFLPELSAEEVVTLGEGGTPLLPARRLGEELGLDNLLIKDESRNPTGSFIDRGSTVLITLAKQRGAKACFCVTTGNLGASLAAYCAKAGIAAKIRIQPTTDRGKLYQMLAYGAQIDVTSRARETRSSDRDALSVTAGNPYILEGEKTTCFEIVQELEWKPPDVIVVPVGTGGHLSMTWRAMVQMRECGLIDRSDCRLLGVQFEGSSPMVARAQPRRESGLQEASFTELEESEPFFRKEVVKAIEESRGEVLMATASETVRATGLLARTEGIFAEPASASVVASLQSAKARGLVHADETVVCIVTGAGLKDTKAISRLARATGRVSVREDHTVAPMQIGETKLAILRSLATKPRYGYELWKSLPLGRRITTASVYQHLGELEGLTLVRKAGVTGPRGRERILYQLTRRGADFLKAAGKLDRAGSG